jgi:hypothetical protein
MEQNKMNTDIKFDAISMTENEKLVLKKLNEELIGLCSALPASLQNQAMLFLFKYSGFSPDQPFDFFKLFYVPTWSFIHWFEIYYPSLNDHQIQNAIRAQAMAMFLHLLDDHLVDGQNNTDNLMLQLRTEAWMRYKNALTSLSSLVKNDGDTLILEMINRYFSGIHQPPSPENLEDFLTISRKQVATWIIAPLLLLKKSGETENTLQDLQKAFEAYFLAWRILDDVQDFTSDLRNGEKSSFFYILPEEQQMHWFNCKGIDADDLQGIPSYKVLSEYIKDNDLFYILIKRVCTELTTASKLCLKHGWNEIAEQYSAMKISLEKVQK